MAKQSTVRAGTVARKSQILDAALGRFTDVGIEATTIDDIRRYADCSTGSIYHHFGSKEGIASELFIDGVQRLNADLMSKLTRCRTAERAVKTVVTQYSDWVTRNRDLAGYLLNSRDLAMSAEAAQMLRNVNRAHIRRVFEFFAPFVGSGAMQVLPVETYIPIISGPIQDYARHWLAGQFKDSPAKVKMVFAEAAWSAMKGADGPRGGNEAG
jgi:AcrR family transcriptional regulator